MPFAASAPANSAESRWKRRLLDFLPTQVGPTAFDADRSRSPRLAEPSPPTPSPAPTHPATALTARSHSSPRFYATSASSRSMQLPARMRLKRLPLPPMADRFSPTNARFSALTMPNSARCFANAGHCPTKSSAPFAATTNHRPHRQNRSPTSSTPLTASRAGRDSDSAATGLCIRSTSACASASAPPATNSKPSSLMCSPRRQRSQRRESSIRELSIQGPSRAMP